MIDCLTAIVMCARMIDDDTVRDSKRDLARSICDLVERHRSTTAERDAERNNKIQAVLLLAEQAFSELERTCPIAEVRSVDELRREFETARDRLLQAVHHSTPKASEADAT